ncbi:MAG TPA: DUF1080 domain-containing protein [Gemmataceae bacterium]|nr:DUF1080 domain-containing protein [Gemmataceae bacterium]
MRSVMPVAVLLLIPSAWTTLVADGNDKQTVRSWRSLPLIKDGKVDPNWAQIGWGGFVVDNGSLRTECDERGMGLLVYEKERFGNCQIRVVYRCKHSKANSGVFVRIDAGTLERVHDKPPAIRRNKDGGLSNAALKKLMAASEHEQGPWYAVHHGYEVQICDDSDEYHRTGGIYSLTKAASLPKNRAADWRTMVITLKGNLVRVDIDGKRIATFDPDSKEVPRDREWYEPKREPKRPRSGYIGLQNHDPGDIVYFKEVSVRPLDGTP